MTLKPRPLELEAWQKSFYAGDRLRAEVELLGAASFVSGLKPQLVHGCALLQSSHGVQCSAVSPFQRFQDSLPEPEIPRDSREQYLLAADCPDALLLWSLIRYLPTTGDIGELRRLQMYGRTAHLLMQRFPKRPDLPFQLLAHEPTNALLSSAPKALFRPGKFYTNAHTYLPQLAVGWVQGRYEDMWLGSLRAQVDGRSFPVSDHHIRGLTIIGEPERCLALFKQLYENSPSDFGLPSISNMFFMALGSELLPETLVSTLSAHFDRLAKDFISNLPVSPPLKQRLEVNEKPLMVVTSSDLRQHPVGRFWLPIARQLRSRFRLIHVAGNTRDEDHIRTELRALSDEWWPLEAPEIVSMARKIRELSPSFLLDLGGHTADNHPVLLSHRLATVQATYLGFFGPTYASCCDWWIIDEVLNRWVGSSYPGAEKVWSLPGPSLCYVPELHGLPEVGSIEYQQPRTLVFGSFNHTRKLSCSSQRRFGAVMSANPDALLKFRSHSFHDPAVRRRFLIRFQDNGIAPHQLQPLPYAPSYADAISDYGRIHLHFDTFPVSGTTTTLDSLAMGIPVLTSPTPYYAGVISSAILEHAGLADHICTDPAHLPSHARWLAERYRTAEARRSLAHQVRQSPICDAQLMPRMFVDQLEKMLRQALSA